MRRRDFLRYLGMGTALIAVPQYGRWTRQGSGVLVPPAPVGPTYKVALYDSSGIEYAGGNYARQVVAPLSATIASGHIELQLPPVTWQGLQGEHLGPLGGYALWREDDGVQVASGVVPYMLVPNGGDVTLRWN